MAASLKRFAAAFSGVSFRFLAAECACRNQPLRPPTARKTCALCAYHKDTLLERGPLLPPSVRLAGRSSSGACWNCSEPLAKKDLVCRRCESPQEVTHAPNYFEVFDEEAKYDIDASKLQGKFRQLQRLLHPDKFAAKSKKEQDLSDNLSALVNQAYQTLSKPDSRAKYLLKVSGKNLDSVVLDTAFLGRMMELNEEVASVEERRDRKSAEEYLKIVQTEAEQVSNQLSTAFQKDNLDQASIELAKLKYLRNIEGKLKEVIEQ
ncbi:iron-sulfur cluster co-chaperone protein HscB-like protein, mitochondrial [Rhipicephalus microplus]|uniref:iron-sulfur cluster co-chaperone protein HscB-like protein, mitochondrial n=1 Tax=Rhipicephalus microplus TaxID=6941 RepID=UPI003F6BC813